MQILRGLGFRAGELWRCSESVHIIYLLSKGWLLHFFTNPLLPVIPWISQNKLGCATLTNNSTSQWLNMRHLFLVYRVFSETSTFQLINDSSPHKTFHIHAYRERKSKTEESQWLFPAPWKKNTHYCYLHFIGQKILMPLSDHVEWHFCVLRGGEIGLSGHQYLLVLYASIPLIFLFWEHSKLIFTLGTFVLGLLWCKSIEHSTSKEWLKQMPHPRRVYIYVPHKDGPLILANAISSEKTSQSQSVTLSSFNFK